MITLLRKLRKEFGLTLIFISHDLSVVRLISDDVLVLYLGKVVEAGDCATVFDRPAHPYTQALFRPRRYPIRSSPATGSASGCRATRPRRSIRRQGCVFSPRCWKATDICRTEMPPTEQVPARTVRRLLPHGPLSRFQRKSRTAR